MSQAGINLTPFNLAFVLYFVGAVAALGGVTLGRRAAWLVYCAYGAIGAGAVAHSVLIGQRWIAGGHPPLSGRFDAVMFFAWTTVVSFAVAEALFRTRWLTVLVGATLLALFGYASDCNQQIEPLMPVLQSTWLTIHVFAYMFGYGVMTVGCFVAICYYFNVVTRGEGAMVQMLDRLTYRFVAFGFPLLTVGLITGAIWANRTWSRYWGWDPKETWSLITWIIYAVFLHFRLLSRTWAISQRRRGAMLNWLAILGFAAIIFTFLLLQYLPSAETSQHIYL